MFKRIMGI